MKGAGSGEPGAAAGPQRSGGGNRDRGLRAHGDTAGPGALLLLIGAFVYALVCLVLSTRGDWLKDLGRRL